MLIRQVCRLVDDLMYLYPEYSISEIIETVTECLKE
jgi:hypothetical protein